MKLKTLSSLLVLSLAAVGAQASQRVCEFQVISSQVYATGLLEQGLQLPLLVDSYLPTHCVDGRTGKVQPVLLIPGGGFNWVERDRLKIVEIAEGLARAGFAVFPIEHRIREWNGLKPVSETKTAEELKAYQRSLKKSPYPGDQHFQALIAMEDSFKAKAWIQGKAAAYNLDVTQFGMVGGSSGACTALGMEYSGDDIGEGMSDFQALIDMWGDFYPHTHMENGESPVLIMAGTADPVIAYDLTTDIMRRAKLVQVDASRITMPGVKHGLDDADIFNRLVVGTDMTVFETMVQFLEAKLRQDTHQTWPPLGQTREMTAEADPPTTQP
jgi:dienelactone hydrolase